MNDEDIVRTLLAEGIMVSPEKLEEIKRTGLGTYLEKRKKSSSQQPGKTPAIKCRVKSQRNITEITPDESLRLHGERFETLRKILLRKADAVSINNIGNSSSKVTVVGMVKESGGGSFVLEDSTGEITVRSGERPETDDVLCVKAWPRDGALTGAEIYFPDVPPPKEIPSMEGILSFGSSGDADVSIIGSKLTCGGGETVLGKTSSIKLESGGKSMNALFHSGDKITRERALSWLKKRQITGLSQPPGFFVIEDVPDLFLLLGCDGTWHENYKGVTIIGLPHGKTALVDLKTREVKSGD